MGLAGSERWHCSKIVILCCLWYSISSSNNIVSKVLLTFFPFPMTLSMVQLLSIALYSVPAFSCLGIRRKCHFTRSYTVKWLLPLALGKFLALVFAHVSVWKVPLSYAHTVKATMPLFTVVLGRLLLNQTHSLQVYGSLVPIVMGVSVATVTELSFDTLGLCSALLSTVLFACMQLFSKQVMLDSGVHHLRLLQTLGQYSFFMFLPFWMLTDMFKLLHSENSAWLARVSETILLLLLDGFLSWLQNIVAFTVLHLVSPLTYAVCNATKRVTIISASLLLLRNPVSAANVLGMLMALTGVFLYNRAKYMESLDRQLLPIRTLPTDHSSVVRPLFKGAAPGIDWADKIQPVYSTAPVIPAGSDRFTVLIS